MLPPIAPPRAARFSESENPVNPSSATLSSTTRNGTPKIHQPRNRHIPRHPTKRIQKQNLPNPLPPTQPPPVPLRLPLSPVPVPVPVPVARSPSLPLHASAHARASARARALQRKISAHSCRR